MTQHEIDRADGSRRGMSRRALFAGVGTSAALLGTAAIAQGEAAAAPAAAAGDGAAHGARHPDVSPISGGIGSAPISGYAYHSACMYDFLPFNPAAQKTWGGSGIYSAGTASPMRANLDIPSGALIRDVEWYVYNSSTSDVAPQLYQYAPGSGLIFNLNVLAFIPANGSSVVAVRASVPSESQGPFPLGSRLLAGLSTPTDGTVQINGVRVGFTHGGGAVGLLPKALRVFDNRKDSKFHAGSTHTITLPASAVAPGVTAVLVNVTAFDGEHGGALKVYAADAAVPTSPALDFGDAAVANAMTVGVSSGRKLKIFVTKPVHIVLDLVGTVS